MTQNGQDPLPGSAALRDSVNVRIPRDLWEAVKEVATREERTMQTTVARLLRTGLNTLDRGGQTHG